MTGFFQETLTDLFNYWVVFGLMMIGFYTVIAHDNLVKKLIGLSVFQISVFILYISVGHIEGSTAPIQIAGDPVYAHPLPQVVVLTAIVVGVSTTALGLALIVRINEAYGSIEEDDVLAADQASYSLKEAEEEVRTETARARESHAPPDADDGFEQDDSRHP